MEASSETRFNHSGGITPLKNPTQVSLTHLNISTQVHWLALDRNHKKEKAFELKGGNGINMCSF